MTKYDRLEDVTPEWRAYFVQNLAGAEEGQVRHRVEAVLPERVATGDPVQVDRIIVAILDARRSRLREAVLPACLKWLRANGCWNDGEIPEVRALNEIAVALDRLAPFEPRLPAPEATVENLSWVLPPAVGAALGAVALTPLSLLLFRSVEFGLFVVGVMGVAALVALVGVLASKPDVVAGLETGLKWVGFIAMPVGIWRGLWGRSTGWLRASAYTLASWLLLGIVRPRIELPSRAEVLAALADQVRRLLLHDADLVLAWCWSHPDRLGQAGQVPSPAPVLSESVCDALGNRPPSCVSGYASTSWRRGVPLRSVRVPPARPDWPSAHR
jgi:hypothetical protein